MRVVRKTKSALWPTITIMLRALPDAEWIPKTLTTLLDRICPTTMRYYIKPSKITVLAYSVFCVFVVADVIVSIFSKTHLYAYGTIRQGSDVVARFLPDFLLLCFYFNFFYTLIRFGEVRRAFILIHSVIFSVFGLGLTIPFIGFILSEFTPVCLLYRFILLYIPTDAGILSIIILGVIFTLFNLWLWFITPRGRRPRSPNQV